MITNEDQDKLNLRRMEEERLSLLPSLLGAAHLGKDDLPSHISAKTDYCPFDFPRSSVHYGEPSLLKRYYHLPFTYDSGTDFGGSGDDEERQRTASKKRRRKNRKRRKPEKLARLRELAIKVDQQQEKLINYFTPPKGVIHELLKPSLSPVRLVAMRGRAQNQPATDYKFSRAALASLGVATCPKPPSRRITTRKNQREMAAIIIQRIFRRCFQRARVKAAVCIQRRVREHQWCVRVVERMRRRHALRAAIHIMYRLRVYVHQQNETRRMCQRHFAGIEKRCFRTWEAWVSNEVQVKEEKRQYVMKRLRRGKEVRILTQWHLWAIDTRKVRVHCQHQSIKALQWRFRGWHRRAHRFAAANIIRRFWKAQMIPLAMHRACCVRCEAAIKIESFVRMLLARGIVKRRRLNHGATVIQKMCRGVWGRERVRHKLREIYLEEHIRLLHEEHSILDIMDEAHGIVTRFVKTRAGKRAINRFVKHLWQLKRDEETLADRALTETFQLQNEDDDILALESNDMLRHKAVFLTTVQMEEFARSVFALVDVKRVGWCTHHHLEDLMGELGVKDPSFDASNVRHSSHSHIPRSAFVEWFVATYPQWEGEANNFFSRTRHRLGYHRHDAGVRAIKVAAFSIIRQFARKIFRNTSPPRFEDELSGLAFGTLQELNVHRRNPLPGPYNQIDAQSKAGLAKTWLELPANEDILSSLTFLALQHENLEQLSKGLRGAREVEYKNNRRGYLVLRYRGKRKGLLQQREVFDFVVPPLYESIDIDRACLCDSIDVMDASVSRGGHVRFSHGMNHTVSVRALGKNGVVVSKMRHGGARHVVEVNRHAHTVIRVKDKVSLYRDMHGQCQHEFELILRRTEDDAPRRKWARWGRYFGLTRSIKKVILFTWK